MGGNRVAHNVQADDCSIALRVGIAANEFGMEWVEIRGLWDKNALKLTSAEIAEAKRIVDRYHDEIVFDYKYPQRRHLEWLMLFNCMAENLY